MPTDSIQASEFTFESYSTVKFCSRILSAVFVAGLCFNVYAICSGTWTWNVATVLFSIFDILIVITFIGVSFLATRQNNLAAVDSILPPEDATPEEAPFHTQLEELNCQYSGTIILKLPTMTNYLEVHISHDRSWFFLRAMTEVYGSKGLEYVTGSAFSPFAYISVTNATRPNYVLPAMRETFNVALAAASPSEVIELHLRLLEEAKWHMIKPRELDIQQIADLITEVNQLNMEFQSKRLLMRRVSPSDYRLTLLGGLYVIIRAWYYMTFELGHRRTTREWCQILHRRFNGSREIQNSLQT